MTNSVVYYNNFMARALMLAFKNAPDTYPTKIPEKKTTVIDEQSREKYHAG